MVVFCVLGGVLDSKKWMWMWMMMWWMCSCVLHPLMIPKNGCGGCVGTARNGSK